jgi:thiol-disulfide isomerase/thioredoxin/sugar lactone lactonase YvrE
MHQSLAVSRKTLERAQQITMHVWVVAGALLILVLSFSVSSLRSFAESARGLTLVRSLASFSDPGTIDQIINGGSMTLTQRQVHAPDFDGAVAWLNVEHPLTIQDLRGKVVLLDFWTYCCINCMHIVPDLKKLEAKYGNDLAVIGVHSAKFQNEKESSNIREAILRYEIAHPVINDANFVIWRHYAVRAWPTLALIDPDGYVVGTVSGEGNYSALDRAIGQLVDQFKAAGKINPKPLPLALEKNKQTPSVLSFPGKIIASEKINRLFIADSNHNRILVTTLEGRVVDVAGAGTEGRVDGDFSRATFHHPQGMALAESGDSLWIADTENHCIRKLDLKKRTVETVAGTGVQAEWGAKGGPARSTPLNSPWDLVEIKGKVYIAMAGSHQLWVFDPEKKEVAPFAGNGTENIADGLLDQASLAQPSGLTTDGKRLYFADSEVSSVRFADLGQPNQVHTLIGEGLFEFGDQDGSYPDARLQHPLGVLYHNGKVLVADTYNHKIKRIDPEKKTVETLLGTGKPGLGDESHPQFYEPGGLAIVNEKLYIADTNNHAIRVADLKTKKVTTLQIFGFDELSSGAPAAGDESGSFFNIRQSFALRSVKPGADGRLLVDLRLPQGYHLNPLAPLSYQIKTVNGVGVSFAESARKSSLKEPKLPIAIPFKSPSDQGKAEIELALTVYYCRTDNQGLCFIKSLDLTQPVEISASASGNDVPINVTIQ